MSSLPHNLRAEAKAAFTGFPTRRVEAYKYSDLSWLEERDLAPMASFDACNSKESDVLFTNGILAYAQSPQAGLTLQSLDMHPLLGKILPLHQRPLAVLNSAYATQVLFIHVAKNVKITKPLTLDVLSRGEGSAYPRVLIVLEEGANLTLVERFSGKGAYMSCGAMEISLAKGARLSHIRDQNEDKAATQLYITAAKIAEHACYSSYVFNEGAAFMRHEILASLDGGGAHVDMLGVNMITDTQHTDTATFINHAAADTTSNELYKSAVAQQATAVFQGKIHVAKDAQRIKGYQMSRGLLLSDKARINTKPELEIYADDVVCSHGATVGALDQESLFYLCARGISRARARALLIEGFIAEVINDLDEVQREGFMQRASLWLEGL